MSLCLVLPFFQTKKDQMKSMGHVVYRSMPMPCRRRMNRRYWRRDRPRRGSEYGWTGSRCR
eukprot:1337019-Pyramimonas_sp.AAC.1